MDTAIQAIGAISFLNGDNVNPEPTIFDLFDLDITATYVPMNCIEGGIDCYTHRGYALAFDYPWGSDSKVRSVSNGS